jgi:hypothetical protein
MEGNEDEQSFYQVQATQGLDNKIDMVCHVVHTNHKRNMILH